MQLVITLADDSEREVDRLLAWWNSPESSLASVGVYARIASMFPTESPVFGWRIVDIQKGN